MKGEAGTPNRQSARAETSGATVEQTAGMVVSLQICAAHRAPMQKLDAVTVLNNLGLEGDRHAIPDGTRQVLFMEEETLDRLGIPIGAVKENVTTRGIDLTHLGPGTQLRIGQALFQLTRPCDPCSRMEEIRSGLQEELEGQRGMLARVIRGGEIRVGDDIAIVEDT
jgi:MOSC domain-containing protein YiiM